MNCEDVYIIVEGSSAYPIRHKAMWKGHGAVSRFHVFVTIEIVPRTLTIHENNIIGEVPRGNKGEH